MAIAVSVYERDESSSSRRQGFRIHIDPDGSRALHSCLPAGLWEIFNLTGGEFSRGFTFVTEQLEELLSMRDGNGPADPIASHRSISRITLRQILLSGLGENVHFDKRLVRYEEASNGRVVAHFHDGTSAESSILIAADGVNSAVRKQFLPEAGVTDTGVVAIGGRIPLTDGVLALAPDDLLDGPVMVVPPQPCSLFMALWKRSQESAEILHRLQIDRPPADEGNYLVLGLGGQAEYLGLRGDLQAIAGSELKQLLCRTVTNWSPKLRKLASMVDEREMSANPIRSSHPVAAWKTTSVTLLGDAIHSMTPYRGIGANVALRDAALLCSKLVEADKGQKPVLHAIGEYEREMREYAFAAVAASLKSMEQAVTQKKNPGFRLAKTAMRVVNRVPALKRRLVPA